MNGNAEWLARWERIWEAFTEEEKLAACRLFWSVEFPNTGKADPASALWQSERAPGSQPEQVRRAGIDERAALLLSHLGSPSFRRFVPTLLQNTFAHDPRPPSANDLIKAMMGDLVAPQGTLSADRISASLEALLKMSEPRPLFIRLAILVANDVSTFEHLPAALQQLGIDPVYQLMQSRKATADPASKALPKSDDGIVLYLTR